MKLNPSVIKEADDVLTKAQVEDLVLKGNKEVYTDDSLSAFVKDVNSLIQKGETDALSESEFESVEKAITEFRDLERVSYYDEKGQVRQVYVKNKPE